MHQKVLSMILVLVMLLGLLSVSAFTVTDTTSSDSADTSYKYNIMFLDCGRKYYSVDSIEKIINNASAAGFNYIQLAVGNDGLRFLLNDMSLTVKGTKYDSETVKSAIHAGNEAYYNFPVDELNQSEMDTIIAYAGSKGMGVIPCVNTPGHMDAILSAANSLTETNCSYNGSVRTIDVTNDTAVAFTKALLQKYIDYFAGQGCKLFNMGADEYANDIYKDGSMGFGNLQSSGKYSSYVDYVNTVDNMIQAAGMTAMAFNDGIYFNSNTSSGTFNTDIIVCYWSNGWSGYSPMSASRLASEGFRLVNTNGSYYWVLGKSDAQCDANKASGFNKNSFPGGKVDNPVGSMFCIWADYPGAESEADVISKTAATIKAFGGALPTVKKVETVESKTVTKGDVAVTAPGLTDLTVTAETAAPTIDTAAEGKVSAYDVTPVTDKGSYAGSGSVSLPVPEGWDASRVRGYVVNGDGSVTTGLTGTIAGDKFTFTVPHFSKMGIYELAANAATETKEITLTVGGTFEKTVSGANYARDEGYTTADETVASVVVNGEDATKSEPIYDSVDVSYSTLTGNNSAWAKTNYYYKDGDEYCPVYAYKQTEGILWWTTTTYHYGYMPDGETAVKEIGNATENSTVKVYEYKGIKEGTPASTTITFTGHKVGDTTVVIGGVTYKIHVTAEDLSKVTPLTVEYWITNKQVTAGGATSKKINATDPSVYSETGAKFSDLVPATGTQGDNTDVFWKGTRLTSANKQTNQSGVDQTRNGNDFAYIRYWNHKWSFSVDGKSWTDFNDGDQVVAYYMQKTDVTSEITTNVVDWGQPYSEWKAGGGDNGWFWNGYVANGSKYVFLDFAVVYEDNTQNPSSFPTDKTLFYHFDRCSETNPRVLGAIRFTENSDYEIWKVTVTDGTSTGYSSYSTFAPTYDNTTETTVWDESMGGIPQIDQLKYTANRSGKLVRVYVRAKVTEDSLTVNYFDENNKSLPFYSYNIAVARGTTFNDGFAYSNGALINNTVTNIKGVPQKVNWKLEEMSEIGAQYRFGNYTFTNATKETGKKVVNLYYRFNSEKTFVVDFGLPLHIAKTDISPELSQANIQGVAVGNSLYATVRANDDYSIDYILNKTIDGSDRITVTYTGTKVNGDSDSATYNLTIIPASTVYYEDDLVEFKGDWTRAYDPGASSAVQQAVQQLDELEKTGANNYGYDDQYNSSSKFSLGSAMKTTVSSATNSTPPTATFTFKGTGFDLVSMTSKDTGTILVNVNGTTENNETVTKHWIVDTFYGYTRKQQGVIEYTWTKDSDGTWHNTAVKMEALPSGKTTGGTPKENGDKTYEPNYTWIPVGNGDNALYQIPVIHYTDLPYGTYTVTVTPKYSSKRDPYYQAGGANNNYDFYLDGVRIYNPAGDKLNSQYVKDGEGYAQFTEIRNMLLKASDLTTNIQPTKGMVFVDGVGDKGQLADYRNYGPNNEVYLSKNQAIAFKIGNMSNVASIQIGAKAPEGNATMQIRVGTNGSQTQPLTTASDMYYELKNVQADKPIVITNTGDTLLSLTTLKVTYKTEPSTSNSADPVVDEEVVAQAPVMLMSMLYGEPQTFEPEHFTAKWSRNVRKGGTATLTVKASADVESITVNGEEITAYTTKTVRSFWGPKETYHVFTYRVTNAATADYTVCALNAKGVASDPITAPLTVRPSIRDWWNGIFDKWKH